MYIDFIFISFYYLYEVFYNVLFIGYVMEEITKL